MFKIEKGAEAYENKTVRLSKETIEKIQKLANDNNLSFNAVIQQCVNYALANMNEDE